MINGMIQHMYFDKGTDFSASDFTQPSYKMWVKHNCKKNEDDKQGFKAFVGSLIHKASYEYPEVDVVKEFSGVINVSGYTIGGSIDRLAFRDEKWFVEDLKSSGLYPAKKAFKEPSESWTIQLSIYKLIASRYGFHMAGDGVIHQYVMGFQKNKDGMEEYNKIEIPLMSQDGVISMLKNRIKIAVGTVAPVNDCPRYLCDSYCSYNKSCPANNLLKEI